MTSADKAKTLTDENNKRAYENRMQELMQIPDIISVLTIVEEKIHQAIDKGEYVIYISNKINDIIINKDIIDVIEYFGYCVREDLAQCCIADMKIIGYLISWNKI